MGMTLLAVSIAQLLGTWGGPQLQLTLTPTGGRLALACAEIKLTAPVMAHRGHFETIGEQEIFVAGPQPSETAPPTSPVHLSGTVTGQRMQLQVRSAGNAVQTYTLERDKPTKLLRCR